MDDTDAVEHYSVIKYGKTDTMGGPWSDSVSEIC